MTEVILGLAIFLGLLSIANKLLLLRGQSAGWITGMIIGAISWLYFYLIELEILALAEAGFFLVMLAGYLSGLNRDSKGITRAFNTLLTGVLAAISVVLFAGMLTVYQICSSLAFIWG